jgi:hypothetical protein
MAHLDAQNTALGLPIYRTLEVHYGPPRRPDVVTTSSRTQQ